RPGEARTQGDPGRPLAGVARRHGIALVPRTIMADNGQMKRDRLQAVLAVYGADPARWPQGDRELASLLAAADQGIDAILNDARNLDIVLARASHPVAPTGAVERLLAKAHDASGRVVSLALRRRARPQMMRAALPRRLVVFTALAASLAFGLYLGASGRSDWLTPPLLAEGSPEYLSAELDLLDGTLQVFEDNMEP
ncbi:MAG TPA: hypothetical protein VMO81_04775, partial [Aestuariivirgaceae bacterium]|nr:hypothetical protein [Aestuariivirgaceae bacterium]